MNPSTIIAGAVVLLIIIVLIRSLLKEKKSGKCSCGCSSCSGKCPHCITPVLKKEKENDYELE